MVQIWNVIWAFTTFINMNWRSEGELKWIFKGQDVRYLGVLMGFKLPRIINEILLVITLTLGLWPRLSYKKWNGPKKIVLGFKHIFPNVRESKKWVLTSSSGFSLWELKPCEFLNFWSKNINIKPCPNWAFLDYCKVFSV